MQQLTNLDSSFLHLENNHSPMHVGGVMLFSAPARGSMTFGRLSEHVFSRMQTARVFRQRLMVPAWHLDAPWWVEDEAFQLSHHLGWRKLAAPITHDNLRALAEEFFSAPLRRDRPLWEMLYVEAASNRDRRQGADFALLLKVHHAALDGVSAEAVITGLLDMTPAARELPRDRWLPEALPDQAELLRRRLASVSAWPAQARELARSSAQLGRRFLQRLVDPGERALPHYFTAPATPFNAPIGGGRAYGVASLPMPRVRQIRARVQGVTVNDVVLAVCAGAVRRYLEDEGALPARSLVAMAPVSKRNDDQKQALGNKVSAMLIRLATDIDDPLLRLRQIHLNARTAKGYSREMTVEALFDQLPYAATAQVLRRFAGRNLARRLPPIFNMVVTNVPGSPVPLYLDGAQLTAISGMAGIFDGMALTLVVLSYCDTLSIGITSAPELLRDPQRLAAYLLESLEGLEAAARREEMELDPPGVAPARLRSATV